MVEAALRNRNASFVLDGEGVLLDANGISDFNGLHSRKRDAEVQLYAFDCLAADGDDLRRLRLSLRKTNLARILARRVDGIHIAPFEQGEIGPDLFRACVPTGTGKSCVETPRERLQGWAITALDQGQEPQSSSVEPGDEAFR
jgi:ATP-dependent DNA ligase